MAQLVYAMNVSLDGFVDHERLFPTPALFQHWTDAVRDGAGLVYGRRIYEIMRYWDEDQPEWGADGHAYAAVWRRQHKWVVSRSPIPVGPNATLVGENVADVVRNLKAQLTGEISVGGPVLAQSLTELGLIDVYRLYYQPVVLGQGKPFFIGPQPALRLAGSDRIDQDIMRLTYVPA